MKKTAKISLITLGLFIFCFAGLIILGMYSMEIEDTYGDNQDIFYNSKEGDIVINK